ncbi:MAG: sensor histidine kinase KdpD [Alphaproteobacteria bacterium]|nr:sensor histidine kinase KdpD [Alphaproteobacteria bacterium]
MTEDRHESELRPSPDALLVEAAKEGRGRLKVFLGAAPGVGKTYAMLEAARRRKADGTDVVVGLVETHGRQETAALVEGLEVLPRKRIAYQGHLLEEFDLDAALARRPGLLLVDELAHTNAEGSRHPKRYMDVDELLKAGIDVYATLNIQHLESLNDIVARITHVRVRETLPDRVLEAANEVELIDLTPEDLLKRLQEGKVYVPYLAERARESFFRPGNLSALREMALRRVAERVDDEMVGYMRSHAIAGPWPAGERLMVCVGNDPLAGFLVRAGRRLADQLKAPWVALHVERGTTGSQRDVEAALGLAERLESRTARLVGADVAAEILNFARRNNITQIIVGRPRDRGFARWLRRSLADALADGSDGIAIHVVTPPRPAKAARRRPVDALPHLSAVVTAVLGIGGVVLLGVAVPDLRSLPNVGMLFLAVVLLNAVRHGLSAALLSAVLASLAYNYFYTEPYFTLSVLHWHDVLALAVFLIVAATTGTLAGRVRDQMSGARARMAALQTLYDFARRLGKAKTSDELLHAVVLQAHRLSGRAAMMLLPQNGELEIRYSWPPDDRIAAGDKGAANWAFKNAEPAGAHTGTLPSAHWHFRPLRAGAGAVGVFGIAGAPEALPTDLAQTLDAMLDQAAVAVERIEFARKVALAETLAETERFRAALLSSISHDLRTPLTSILGSVTALRRDPGQFDAEARGELLATIQEEAERLDRFVVNLLDITRLEAGAIKPKREWLQVAEVVDTAARRVAGRLGDRGFVRTIPSDLPLLRGDFVLLETVLANLLDNAAKHAANARRIEVSAGVEGAALCISVVDDGDGVPPALLPRLFDKFFRIQRRDRTVAGTGLGLSICKGLTEAMGGTIEAQCPIADGRGMRFTLRFPLEPQPAPLEPSEARA